MKIRLLIASSDGDYTEHFSRVLTEKYEDVFEVTICSTAARLTELQRTGKFDVILLEPELAPAPLEMRLCLFLWDGESSIPEMEDPACRIRKYQRISQIVGELLERYAEVSSGGLGEGMAHVSVVWSPSGGCGKTTVALAYAAWQVSQGKKTVYLDLEPFSSTPVYFTENGKSISAVFVKLDGNVELLLQSIRQEDSGSGIRYFCPPDNYDDIAVLTEEDAVRLAAACTSGADEVVIDLGNSWNQRTSALLEMADRIFMVVDASKTSQMKWEQFQSQHNAYDRLRNKITVVANRGARVDGSSVESVRLPLVGSEDPVVVYKTLSAGYF